MSDEENKDIQPGDDIPAPATRDAGNMEGSDVPEVSESSSPGKPKAAGEPSAGPPAPAAPEVSEESPGGPDVDFSDATPPADDVSGELDDPVWYDDEEYDRESEPPPAEEPEAKPEPPADEWHDEEWEGEDWAADEEEAPADDAGRTTEDAAATATPAESAAADAAPASAETAIRKADTAAARSEDEQEEEEEGGGPKMSLVDHLEELRMRLLWALLGLFLAMVVTLIFGKQIMDLLNKPYYDVVAELGLNDKLKVDKPFGGISIYFTVALVTGLILASPWVFYQIWMFVSAGLYKKERKYVLRSLPFSVALFVAGAVFFLTIAAKPMMTFLLSFNQWLNLEPIITQNTQLGFMCKMMLVFGLGFQLPLVVLILVRVGLVERKTIARYRKYIIVALVIFAAIMTPPDVTAQLVLAVPMWLLFELGMFLARFAEKKRAQQELEASSD